MDQNNTQSKAVRPEDMPEHQDQLSQVLIRSCRKRFLHWSDERIIEGLEAL